MTPSPSAPPTVSLKSIGVDTGQRVGSGSRLMHLLTPCRNLAIKFFQNPRWGLMFTLGRFRLVSNAVVFFHRRPVLRPRKGGPFLFDTLDVDTAVENLRRDGVHAGVNLDADVLARITRFAHSTECYWPGDPSVRFLHANRADAERRCRQAIVLGRYFDVEDRCEAIRAVAHDPVLHYLASAYLGAAPGQIETRLWWSFVSDATSDERRKADQGFHYDLHDYRCIAFFFHLTDVGDFDGPHVHIKGSHVHKPIRLLLGDTRQASDEEMLRHYGVEKIVTLCGPAGFGFATDPFGYHKGAPPLRHHRLMLRVRFTINDDGSRVDTSASMSMSTAPH